MTTQGDAVSSRRVILGVFAHPDDETSGCGGTFTKYAAQGVDIHVITATRGELGTLGTGDMHLTREELPAVRESELRAVLLSYGANPPILLDYRDQEVKDANQGEIIEKVFSVMMDVRPDVVITFGPMGISQHDDHVAMHRAALAAFDRYRPQAVNAPRLFYVAIPKEIAQAFGIPLEGPEVEPTTIIDISDTKAVKVQGLRTYASQKDAQELADRFSQMEFSIESFHQAYPPVADGLISGGFWE